MSRGVLRRARGHLMNAAVVAIVAVWYAASYAASLGVVLQDDLRHEVVFAHPPQRIISLLPSLTETVCALGACDRLIATDRFSNWPAQVLALPKVGGLDDAAVESIVRLRPDLILAGRSQRITDRLRELHIRTFELNTETYADIGRMTRIVGQILDVPERAVRLGNDIETAVGQIGAAAAARRHGAGPSVYFEVDRAPYAAGPESFIGELLARLGTRNIVTADLGLFPKLNPEYVVRHDPDVIFVSLNDSVHLAERPGWDALRAVKEHRLCSFAPAVRDAIVRPGPRVPEGMRALAECLARVAP
jgi:iron complex transport system substrate-binding protein